MFRRLLLIAAVLLPLSVHAQDDSCEYAQDNECDEPDNRYRAMPGLH